MLITQVAPKLSALIVALLAVALVGCSQTPTIPMDHLTPIMYNGQETAFFESPENSHGWDHSHGYSHSAIPPMSLEKLIIENDVVARVRPVGIEAHAMKANDWRFGLGVPYIPELWHKFEVVEYLKGSGADKIVGVAPVDGDGHLTPFGARAAANSYIEQVDPLHRNREAIVFLRNSMWWVPSTEHSDRYFLGKITLGRVAGDSDKPIEGYSTALYGGWLPLTGSDGASGASGASSSADPVFMLKHPDGQAQGAPYPAYGASGVSGLSDDAISLSAMKSVLAKESEYSAAVANVTATASAARLGWWLENASALWLMAKATDSSVTLAWQGWNGSAFGIKSYEIFRRAQSETKFVKIADVEHVEQDEISYVDSANIVSGAEYTYEVRALTHDLGFGERGGDMRLAIKVSLGEIAHGDLTDATTSTTPTPTHTPETTTTTPTPTHTPTPEPTPTLTPTPPSGGVSGAIDTPTPTNTPAPTSTATPEPTPTLTPETSGGVSGQG